MTGGATPVPWEPWLAKAVSEEERDRWAANIINDRIVSSMSGDSMVWAEPSDAGTIEITDVLVRRSATVPRPEGWQTLGEKRDALIEEMKDALTNLLAFVDGMNVRMSAPGAEAALLAPARAALAKAGGTAP